MIYCDELENIQSKKLKYLCYKIVGVYSPRGFPHEQFLQRFKTESLLVRKRCQSVIFLYKVINNAIDAPNILENINFNVSRLNSRYPHSFSLTTPRTRLLLDSPHAV